MTDIKLMCATKNQVHCHHL